MSNNIVTIDADLEDLIPGFLDNRKKDVEKIHSAMMGSDFATVKSIGHSLKGVGGGYGFHDISRIGAEIEEAAKASSAEAVNAGAAELDNYLNSLEIRYE